jgi:hypothetical protein
MHGRLPGLTVASVALCLATACAPLPAARPAATPPPAPALVLADAVPAETASTPPPAADTPREDAVEAEGGEPAARLDRRRTLRTLGWISVGVAGESLLVAIPTSIILLQKKGDLNSDCNAQKQCSQAGLNEANSLPALTVVNTISWALAAVGAGAGIILLYTTKPDGEHKATVSVSPGVGGAVVSGTF